MTSTSDRSSTSAEHAVAEIQRAEWGRLISLLVARTRRLDLAEDALGDAFERAVTRWPRDGTPDNPVGWLYTTAHRQILGHLRAEAVAARKAPLLAVRPGWSPPDEPREELADDRLHLILLCCHPALPAASRSALALRLVIGTPTEQIARLFLVPTPTMAARITRAKQKIVLTGIPLGDPLDHELRSRLDEVCRTIYLAFTAGYVPGAGPDLLRSDLASDAVRLAAVLHAQTPDAPQVGALLALLLLQHSRRDAREHDGCLMTLTEQDRSSWRYDEIDTGLTLLDGLSPGDGYAEQLRLQALIAAQHARATTIDATNWVVIAEHYARLEELTRSPVVRLNRAVAIAEIAGPRAGLALLADLDEFLPASHQLAAVRADLAERAGDLDNAVAGFRLAIEQCPNEVERRHLQRRLAQIVNP